MKLQYIFSSNIKFWLKLEKGHGQTCFLNYFQIFILSLSVLSTPWILDLENVAEASQIEDYLTMDLNSLMQIPVTSVSKRDQVLGEIAAAVYVITSEDIARSGVTTIADALALAPGIHVARITASKWSVSARGFAGFSSNKLLVLLDGRSVYSPLYSGTFWDTTHTMLEDIERIEVIRGPGGTIWGANAVNGVINIITKPAEQTQQVLLRTSLGNEEYSAATRVGWQLGETVFGRIYALGESRDSNRIAGSESEGKDDWDTFETGFKIDGDISERTTYGFQGNLQKNSGQQMVFPDWQESGNFANWRTQGFSPPWGVIDLDTEQANIVGRLEHKLEGNQKFSLQMYYDHSKRNEDILNFNTDTLDFDLHYELPLDDIHLLTLGGGYRFVNSTFNNNYKYSVTDADNEIYSAFIQDEIRLFTDRLITTFGIKYENNDFTGSEWQPSARILWKALENQSFWAAVSKAVRTPSFIENSSSILLSVIPLMDSSGNPVVDPSTGELTEVAVYLAGNSSFGSETLYSAEIGHRWQVTEDFSTDIALFYNHYKDIYGFVDDGVSPYLLIDNALKADGYGLEAAITWHPWSWLSLEANYTLQQIEFDDSETNLTGSVIEGTTPSQMAGIRGGVDLSKQWQINMWLRWQDQLETMSPGSMYMNTVKIDPFFILNANVIWKPKPGLEFMLAGQNLLESGQLQYVSEFTTPATEIERSVFFKVTCDF